MTRSGSSFSSTDVRPLFAARTVRLFSYGFLSVVSLWITTTADRISRRKMLILGAALMTAAGMVFALSSNVVVLAAAPSFSAGEASSRT